MNVYETKPISSLLESNTYPGRGIVIGQSEDGKSAVFAYFIMGRSENSRNRIFEYKNGGDKYELTIYPFDPSKVSDPSLIIYSPVRSVKNCVIVTNGDQTDTVYDFIKEGKTFEEALETRCFEPDAPNFTPRISGILDFESNAFTYKMSILKSGDEKGGVCNRYTYSYSPVSGVGHFIHTYNRDGTPIPTFTGEPRRVEIPNDAMTFANQLWTSLNADNKISLHVCYIDLQTKSADRVLINKYNK